MTFNDRKQTIVFDFLKNEVGNGELDRFFLAATSAVFGASLSISSPAITKVANAIRGIDFVQKLASVCPSFFLKCSLSFWAVFQPWVTTLLVRTLCTVNTHDQLSLGGMERKTDYITLMYGYAEDEHDAALERLQQHLPQSPAVH